MSTFQKKIAIVRRYNKSVADLKKEVEAAGFTYVTTQPEIVVSVGGDGTFFFAERKYPGIPKLLVRESKVCQKCNQGSLRDILMQYRKGYFKLEEYYKLKANVKRKKGKMIKGIACNDVILRNKILTRALRFSVKVDSKIVDAEIIGDGIVVSSPFGSEAYFKAISHKSFTKGIGLAFNNTTKQLNYLIARQNATISIEILREKADLGFDNDPKIYTLQEGDIIEVSRSDKVMKVVRVK